MRAAGHGPRSALALPITRRSGSTILSKVAGTLRQHAGKIEQQSDDMRTALTRLLSQAQSALSAAADAAHHAA
ncbi:MAG: hypothetical protein ACRDTD_03435 [Pseudonocardiaceae bacterium]